MRTYTIKLGDEDFELLGSFENWSAVEKIAGKVYSIAGKISASELGLCDVVNIYHQMQHQSSKNQEEIIEAVISDGLVSHMEQIVKILSETFSGGNKGKSEKK